MKSRQVLMFAAATALVLGAGMMHRLQAQGNFDNVEITVTHVAGSIHMLSGAGGNIGVSAGSDGLLMVDDQFAPLADKIRAALKSLGSGKLAYVLNTHYHGDHTGSNASFAAEAPIVAHENVRRRLADGTSPMGGPAEPQPAAALPVITFDGSVTLHFNGEAVEVTHFPTGHTDGDSIVFFTGSNVVHMGDHFFAARFPFIDLKGGGDVEGYARNVKAVLARVPADVKIIPGHGPLSTVKDLERFRDMLDETTTFVRQAMAAGKSVEEIKEAGLPAVWDEWGTGFIKTDRWLETIYNSLNRDAH